MCTRNVIKQSGRTDIVLTENLRVKQNPFLRY